MADSDALKQYKAAMSAGKRFIDQVRTEVPTDTSFVKRKFLDIPYAGGSDRRKLDIYLPNEGEGPFPVIVDLYGGGWYFGEKSTYKIDLSLELLKRGFAVVSPNYTLSRDAMFPIQVYEIKAAVRYIRNHAAEYDLDPARIALKGESAGSHLGSVAALSTGAGMFEDIPFGEAGDSSVSCMIALYCPANLGSTPEQFAVLGLDPWVKEAGQEDSPEAVLLGGALDRVPRMVALADPGEYVNPDAPAFLFYHGDDDRVVPYIQSMDLAVRLTKQIGSEKTIYRLIHGAGHNQAHFMTEEIYDEMEKFLRKYLRA